MAALSPLRSELRWLYIYNNRLQSLPHGLTTRQGAPFTPDACHSLCFGVDEHPALLLKLLSSYSNLIAFCDVITYAVVGRNSVVFLHVRLQNLERLLVEANPLSEA